MRKLTSGKDYLLASKAAQMRMQKTAPSSGALVRRAPKIGDWERIVRLCRPAASTSESMASCSNFGANETVDARTTAAVESAVPDDNSLDGLLTLCANFGGSQGFFNRRDEEVTDALNLGFALYARICDDPGAKEALRDRLHQRDAERKPSLKNVAHLVMRYLCRANTEGQRKICSDYSTVLLWAADQNITPPEFRRAWASTTLEECKKHVRRKRRASRAAIDPQVGQTERYLELRVVQQRKVDVLGRWSVPTGAYETFLRDREMGTITTINESDRSLQSLHAFLRAIEDALDLMISS